MRFLLANQPENISPQYPFRKPVKIGEFFIDEERLQIELEIDFTIIEYTLNQIFLLEREEDYSIRYRTLEETEEAKKKAQEALLEQNTE